MNIRKATHEDVPQIVAMGAAMHAESPRYRDLSFVPQKLADLAAKLIGGAIAGGVLVAEADGVLVGMFGYIVSEHFFGIDSVAFELAVYVKPDERGKSTFPRLVKAFEDDATARGAREVQFGITTGVHTEKMVSVFKRLGYADSGVNVYKRLR